MERHISDWLSILDELINPSTFLKEVQQNTNEYSFNISNIPKCYNFFMDRWSTNHDHYLEKLIWLCGRHTLNYLFDVFFTEFYIYETEYFIDTFIKSSSKTISHYFNNNQEEIFKPKFEKYPKTWKSAFQKLPPKPEYISQKYWYDFQKFLEYRKNELFIQNKIFMVNRQRLCFATNHLFWDSDYGCSVSYDNRRIPHWEVLNYHIDIHPFKLDAFRRAGTDEEVNDSIHDLRDFLDFLGFIPSKYTSIWDILRKIPRNNFIQFINSANKVFYPIRYAIVFGDWIKAVVATGFLGDNEVIKGRYGYRVLAKDGHVCNSIAEKIIDDWLFDNLIEHEKEPLYPKSLSEMFNSKFRADWKVGDAYIEYFGLQINKDYAIKTSKKVLGCKLKGIKMIALYPGDEYNLDKTLKSYLK